MRSFFWVLGCSMVGMFVGLMVHGEPLTQALFLSVLSGLFLASLFVALEGAFGRGP